MEDEKLKAVYTHILPAMHYDKSLEEDIETLVRNYVSGLNHHIRRFYATFGVDPTHIALCESENQSFMLWAALRLRLTGVLSNKVQPNQKIPEGVFYLFSC